MTPEWLHETALAEIQRTTAHSRSANGASTDGSSGIVAWSTADGQDSAGRGASHWDGDGSDGRHDEIAELRKELRGLQQRQLTLGIIEQAKGMLMGYCGISADAAFAVLRRWSQDANIKLRDVAAAFVAAGAQPHHQPYGAVQAALRQQPSSDLDRAQHHTAPTKCTGANEANSP